MTPTVEVKKGRDGWRAETVIPLDAPRVLTITTSKGGRGLSTYASVAEHKPDGIITFRIPGDYSKRLAVHAGVRCTQKNAELYHINALEQLPAVLLDVGAFYANEARS